MLISFQEASIDPALVASISVDYSSSLNENQGYRVKALLRNSNNDMYDHVTLFTYLNKSQAYDLLLSATDTINKALFKEQECGTN
jgi:hypothetical protein